MYVRARACVCLYVYVCGLTHLCFLVRLAHQLHNAA